MLIIALVLNCLILAPLTYALIIQSPGMDGPHGADTDARCILTCIYATIGLVSAYALVHIGMGARPVAVHVAQVLFPIQIAYKLGTVALVELGNPVVITY